MTSPDHRLDAAALEAELRDALAAGPAVSDFAAALDAPELQAIHALLAQAHGVAQVGARPPEMSRLTGVRRGMAAIVARAVLQSSRFLTRDQRIFNGAIIGAVNEFVALWQRVEAEHAAATSALERRVEELEERAAILDQAVRPRTDATTDEFDRLYEVIEQNFRGSRDLVRERLSHYRADVVDDARDAPEGSDWLDIGSGRGEWLELLGEWGVPARGVDTDARATAAASARELRVECVDGLSALQAVPNRSLRGVSMFHVLEHVKFSEVLALLHEAYRATAEGGVLIVETPNPQNIVVGAHTFFLDPTHRHPIPPALMSLVVTDCGWQEVQLRPLSPDEQVPRPAGADPFLARLHELVAGARDYAVVAKRR